MRTTLHVEPSFFIDPSVSSETEQGISDGVAVKSKSKTKADGVRA